MNERSTNPPVARFTLFALGLLFLSASAGWGQDFAWVASLKQATLSITPRGEALVEESRPLHLRPGTNRVRFTGPDVNLEPGSLRLSMPRSGNYQLVESYSVRGDNARTWVIDSSRKTRITARVSYELNRVRRWDEYRVELHPDASHFDFVQRVFLTNHSGRGFDRVWIGLGHGYWVPRPWPSGQAKKLFTYRVNEVPFERIYRYKAGGNAASSESHSSPEVTYQFANTNAYFLGDIPLPGGMVRLYEPSPSGETVFVGEDEMSPRQRGDSVVLTVGRTEDLKVDRQETFRERFNIRRDRSGNLELYDRRVGLEYRIQNFRSDTSVLRIRETITGEWDLVESNHDSRRPDHDTLVLPLRLGPKESARVRVEYVQRHLQP